MGDFYDFSEKKKNNRFNIFERIKLLRPPLLTSLDQNMLKNLHVWISDLAWGEGYSSPLVASLILIVSCQNASSFKFNISLKSKFNISFAEVSSLLHFNPCIFVYDPIVNYFPW